MQFQIVLELVFRAASRGPETIQWLQQPSKIKKILHTGDTESVDRFIWFSNIYLVLTLTLNLKRARDSLLNSLSTLSRYMVLLQSVFVGILYYVTRLD